MQYITPAYRSQKCTCVRELPTRLHPSQASTCRCVPAGTPSASCWGGLGTGTSPRHLPAAGRTHKNTGICFSQGKNSLKSGDALNLVMTESPEPAHPGLQQMERGAGCPLLVHGGPALQPGLPGPVLRPHTAAESARARRVIIWRTIACASRSSKTAPSPCSAQVLRDVPNLGRWDSGWSRIGAGR